MSTVTRISVSIDEELLAAFDQFSDAQGYPTRSEAVKAIMRAALIDKQWEGEGTVAGAVQLVYDHHRHDLLHEIMHIQHDYGEVIISSQHVHLDHDNCLEVVTVKGEVQRIRALARALRSVKGIKHSSLLTTTAGTALP